MPAAPAAAAEEDAWPAGDMRKSALLDELADRLQNSVLNTHAQNHELERTSNPPSQQCWHESYGLRTHFAGLPAAAAARRADERCLVAEALLSLRLLELAGAAAADEADELDLPSAEADAAAAVETGCLVLLLGALAFAAESGCLVAERSSSERAACCMCSSASDLRRMAGE